jgi:hypothetical protein
MKRIHFLCALILAYSCSNPKVEDLKTIDVFSTAIGKITNLSEVAAEIGYIPLQTTKETIMSYIFDIKSDETKLYVYLLDRILCFDKTGNYLYKLNKVGRGPEEYTFIYDWDISPENNLLMLLSNKKILIYKNTGSSFEFLKSLSFKEEPSHADFVPNNKMILVSTFSSIGTERFRNVLIDLEGDTINIRPNYYAFNRTSQIGYASRNSNIIYIYNNSIYFKEVTSDTIFSLDPMCKIIPCFILNTNNLQPTPDIYANFSLEQFFTEYAIIERIMEVPRYIYYFLLFKKHRSFGIYDKVKNVKYDMDAYTFLKDDISGGINFEPKFCSNGLFYSWVDALTLKTHIASENFAKSEVKNPAKKRELQKLADSLKETDNPVLIVMHPKK